MYYLFLQLIRDMRIRIVVTRNELKTYMVICLQETVVIKNLKLFLVWEGLDVV
jgi:DNA-binding cell septation regulator SpoVG